jgi:hypothetical protein
MVAAISDFVWGEFSHCGYQKKKAKQGNLHVFTVDSKKDF